MLKKINKDKISIIVLIGILLAILAIGMINNVNAVDSANKTSENGNKSLGVIKATNTTGTVNTTNRGSKNSTTNAKTKPPSNNAKTNLKDGCSSIILHLNSSSYVYGYRRDATYSASLYLKKVKLYGNEALKEYKTTNTYFFHSIIFKNGWYLGAGGIDNPRVNKYLEDLGAKMVYKKKISSTDMKKAMKKVRSLGLGHFVIKSPNGKVGVVIYNKGSSKLSIFNMKSGEYLVIPNSIRFYKKGKIVVKKSNPVDAGIYIAGSDRFGVNRRNIMMYNVNNIKYNNISTNKTISQTKIKIWTTNDSGKYVGRSTAKRADDVIFKGKKILAKSIQKIPNKKYVGELILN